VRKLTRNRRRVALTKGDLARSFLWAFSTGLCTDVENPGKSVDNFGRVVDNFGRVGRVACDYDHTNSVSNTGQ